VKPSTRQSLIQTIKSSLMLDHEKARPNLSGRDYGYEAYARTLRGLVSAFWRGDMNFTMFVFSFGYAIERGFQRAWVDGMKDCGMSFSDMTAEERARLSTEINLEISFVNKFADDIEKNNRASRGKLSPLVKRIKMWANRYYAIKHLAKTYACSDQKYRWVMGATREHCPSCLKLENRVYRASIWRKYGIEPRSRILSCRGYNCLCEFVKTDDPVTPGRPPNLP
jgi:hypothetical protein